MTKQEALAEIDYLKRRLQEDYEEVAEVWIPALNQVRFERDALKREVEDLSRYRETDNDNDQ